MAWKRLVKNREKCWKARKYRRSWASCYKNELKLLKSKHSTKVRFWFDFEYIHSHPKSLVKLAESSLPILPSISTLSGKMTRDFSLDLWIIISVVSFLMLFLLIMICVHFVLKDMNRRKMARRNSSIAVSGKDNH